MNTINNKKFRNANEAYEYLHDRIIQDGVDFAGTKALFNVGFYITDPMDNKIINKERNWKKDYAEAEWQWYLKGSPYVSQSRSMRTVVRINSTRIISHAFPYFRYFTVYLTKLKNIWATF